MMLLAVPQIAKMLDCTEDTVRRYFRKKILHIHEIGSDGVSFRSHPDSVKVRIETLRRARTEVRSLERLGRAFTSVAGPDDQFIMKQVQAGESVATVAEAFIAQVRLKLAS